MARKIVALVLLVALVVNLMGHFVIFQCNRFLLRQEMAAMIRTGSLAPKYVNIVMASGEAQIDQDINGDKEFFYEGVLYDVVSATSANGHVVITCIPDRDEQSLVDRFTRFLHENPVVQESKKNKPILALIHHLLIQALPGKAPSLIPFTMQEFRFPNLTCIFLKIILKAPSPPPEQG